MKKSYSLLITLLLALCLPFTASAVMLVDSTPITNLSGSDQSSFTGAYTVAESGNNNTLVVVFNARGSQGNDPTPTSATFGGVAMSIADTQTFVDGSNTDFRAVTSIFYLNQADFGGDFTSTAQDLVITKGTDNGVNVAFMTLSGVNQADTIGQSNGTGLFDDDSEMSLTLTGLQSNSLIVSGASGSFSSSNIISGTTNIDTTLFDVTPPNMNAIGGLTNVTGSSETLGYTYDSTSGRSSTLAVEFVAVPEPSAAALLLGAMGGLLLLGRRRRF